MQNCEGTFTFSLSFALPIRYVGKFIPRKERNQDQGLNQRYTNVYVKNFGEDFDYEKLVSTFDKFGKIVSAVVMVDETGKGRGFGFVSFETHDAAAKVSCKRLVLVSGLIVNCVLPRLSKH